MGFKKHFNLKRLSETLAFQAFPIAFRSFVLSHSKQHLFIVYDPSGGLATPQSDARLEIQSPTDLLNSFRPPLITYHDRLGEI